MLKGEFHFVERRIDLDAADWQMAVGRPRVPLVRPTPAPFQVEACLGRLARVKGDKFLVWKSAGITPAMSRAEAFFWLSAMAVVGGGGSLQDAVAALKTSPPTEEPTFDDVCRQFEHARQQQQDEIMMALACLLDFDQTMALVLESKLVYAKHKRAASDQVPWRLRTLVNEGLRRWFFPYFTEQEMARLRSRVAPLVARSAWPSDDYERPAPIFVLAALGGCPQALLPVVEAIPSERYVGGGWDRTYYHQPQLIVLGLGDARLVDLHMRRLKLPLNREPYLRGWLANTEYAGLDYARDSIQAIGKKDECEQLLRILALVKAPEAALPMLELKLSSKAPWVAKQWLEENLGCAVAGLADAACGRGRLAEAALDFLRDVKRAGHEDVIRDVIGEAGFERVRREVLDKVEKVYAPLEAWPDWLPAGKASKLPGWLRVDDLPPLVVGEYRLSGPQVEAVLGALQQTSPILGALRQHAFQESLDAFAWRLFETWLAEGAPSKDKWALSSVGLLGSDALALKLTPLIRAWPGESQHQRAVLGLDCLMGIGTDTALMCLNGIAQKLPFKALKARAAECMESIARQRGMTRAELEDRIVPDCDLDERGTRVFDFGSRQFTFLLGPEMKAMVRDGEGRTKADLPSPNSKDDAEKVREAVEAWKFLKKQVKEVAKLQAERLEQAMGSGRRWTVEEFRSLLVGHPLMSHLVRLLVWGGYGADGALRCTFRVTEERAFADAHDDMVALDGVERVGIAHPLHLSDEVKAAWGELLTDYQVVPPFPQLGRPIFRLEPAEAVQKDITRFGKRKLPATSLVGTLERLAWARGIPQDAGVFCEHSKPFPGAGVTAVVVYDGVPVGWMDGWDEQEIHRCFFVPGIHTPEMYPDYRNALPLGAVDPVALSEVLKDLTLLASKGV